MRIADCGFNRKSKIPNPKSVRRALTLIELLVVLVLIGLLAGGLTLRLGGSTERARLRAATLQIEQTLRLARHHARTRRQPVWLRFELGGGRYRWETAASAQRPGVHPWKSLDHVVIERAALRHNAAEEAGTAGDVRWNASTTALETFVVRITPRGASLPWTLQLRSGTTRRIIWSDGITGRLGFQDGLELTSFQWSLISRISCERLAIQNPKSKIQNRSVAL